MEDFPDKQSSLISVKNETSVKIKARNRNNLKTSSVKCCLGRRRADFGRISRPSCPHTNTSLPKAQTPCKVTPSNERTATAAMSKGSPIQQPAQKMLLYTRDQKEQGQKYNAPLHYSFFISLHNPNQPPQHAASPFPNPRCDFQMLTCIYSCWNTRIKSAGVIILPFLFPTEAKQASVCTYTHSNFHFWHFFLRCRNLFIFLWSYCGKLKSEYFSCPRALIFIIITYYKVE